MILALTLAAFFLLLCCAVAQNAANFAVQSSDFSGEDISYQVVLTGIDIPPGFSSTDVSAQNKIEI